MIRGCFFIGMLAAASLCAAGAPIDPSKPTVEVMFNELSAKKNGVGPLSPGVVITPTNLAMIADDKRFYLVGWGGTRPVDGLSPLKEFDYSPNGDIVGINGKDLIAVSKKKRKLEKVLTLPHDDMGLASGQGKLYLYDRAGTGKHSLYVLLKDMKALKLFDSPEPIGAVLEDGDGILFAAGTGIYRFGADKTTKLVLGLPKGSKNITALVQDPVTKRIYASDGSIVFSFKGKDVVVITRENGGALRWFGDGLVIFDPKAPLLIRVRGLPS